jgi:toxin secretion/phage lysis holin
MNIVAIKNGVVAVLAVIGSAIANALGGWDTALQVLLIFMAVDYITGLIVAGVFKKSSKSESGALESRAGLKGLIRKLASLLVVLVGVCLDRLVGGAYARVAAIIFFCANEGISILENVGLMGVPFPKFLKDALEVLRKKGDEGSGGAA